MSAYIVVGFTPKNGEKLKQYGASAAPTLAKHQGEFLVKGPAQGLNGESSFENQIIITFPSRELAESWYHSPEYQALIPLRDEGMDAQFQLVG